MSDRDIRLLEREAATDPSAAPALDKARTRAQAFPMSGKRYLFPRPQRRWIVQASSASMPRSCRGRYARVGLVELELGMHHLEAVSGISARAAGVHRVVETWERLNVGKTDQCAYSIALVQAREMADAHNCRAGFGGPRRRLG